MSSSFNFPAHLLSLLSAFELEEVFQCLSSLIMEVSGAHTCALAFWDADMEAFADSEVSGKHIKEMKQLLDSFMAGYNGREEEVTFVPFQDLKAPQGNGNLISFMPCLADLGLELEFPRALAEAGLIVVRDSEAIKAFILLAADEFKSEVEVYRLLETYPLAFVLARGFEVVELQRENERLRSQYEEIEDKTTAMEEQTRKLIHDITARDSIRMKQLERERLVYWIANAVKSSVHIEEVLNITVEKIGATFGVSRCHLLRVGLDDDDLVVFEYVGQGVPSVKELFVTEMGREFTHKALSKGAPENLEDPEFDDRSSFNRLFLKELALRSGLTVPIVLRERTLGVLFLQDLNRSRDWSIDDISLIGSLADNLSVAIENAELHREREKQAVTDGLTGVFNRRAFNEALQKEFERAKRYDQALSLVIVDLDYLKRINDNFGHTAGDAAIRSIGALLRQSSRSIDFCARYGGEEFCLLLPNTQIDMAEQLAERLRKLINEIEVDGYGKISASLGVSNFPLHCDSAEELFALADAALYRAKETGRNRVVVADSMPGHDVGAEVNANVDVEVDADVDTPSFH
jgi:diguanylate cyclase (GGDEF)-like protein